MNAALSKAKQDKVKCRLACLAAHFRYAEQGCIAYRLASEAAAEKNGDKLAEAEQIARQATGATEEVRPPDASCIDVEIIPASLDRILKPARDAMRTSAKSRPSRIDQDHRN
jgi:ABC-type bacteriocin/lantibiotic exporter with double-glycine peptidase domain